MCWVCGHCIPIAPKWGLFTTAVGSPTYEMSKQQLNNFISLVCKLNEQDKYVKISAFKFKVMQ